MTLYVKKPETVEAWMYNGYSESVPDEIWMTDNHKDGLAGRAYLQRLAIKSENQVLWAEPTDYILKHESGTYSVMKNTDFVMQYDLVPVETPSEEIPKDPRNTFVSGAGVMYGKRSWRKS